MVRLVKDAITNDWYYHTSSITSVCGAVAS
jgi:hypothetical protein